MKPILANLGCGARFHADWINLDLHSAHPGVIPCDLSRGVPLADDSCDGVFNSALLEHLRPADAASFIRECQRILKPGGILRIGVPDLENLARTYLQQLERAVAAQPGAHGDYSWMVLELLDQLVRDKSGGQMADFIRTAPNPEYITSRIGDEYTELVSALSLSGVPAWQRLRQLPPAVRRHKILNLLRAIPGKVRRFAAGLILSSADRAALQEGRFRRSGEIHQWMYDRYSLSVLLSSCGFHDIHVRLPGESAIPNWADFGLDRKRSGEPVKPDLLYLECAKQARPNP
jgi:SAM-dependent methyltransferase